MCANNTEGPDAPGQLAHLVEVRLDVIRGVLKVDVNARATGTLN